MTALRMLYLFAVAFCLCVGLYQGFEQNWIVAGYAVVLAFVFNRFRKVLR